jgi:hypothetical protein
VSKYGQFSRVVLLTAWHRRVEHSSRLRNPGTHALICLFPPFVSFSFYTKYSEIDVSRLEEIEVVEYLDSNIYMP